MHTSPCLPKYICDDLPLLHCSVFGKVAGDMPHEQN